MTFSGLRGRADRPSAPLSVAAFGVASGLCALVALIMAVGQWPQSGPTTQPAMVEYVPALTLASLGVLGSLLCAGFSCLVAAVHRLGR